MEISKLLKIDCIETEKVGMILSNHINLMYQGDAAVTIKVWNDLIADLIKWKSTAHNSGYCEIPSYQEIYNWCKGVEKMQHIANITEAIRKLGNFA